MRFLSASLLLLTLVLGLMFGAQQGSAQDATPAGDCAPLTEVEVLALAESYITAVEAGDAEQIDEILHDDVSHNFAGIDENVPGNDDEVAIYEQFGPTDFTTLQTFVDVEKQTAVIFYSYSFLGGEVTGTAIVIIELECGDIKEIHQESTSIGVILGASGIDPQATPQATPEA